MGNVEHRWKKSLDDLLLAIFEDAADRLKWAWDLDRKDPKSYPVNTFYSFAEISNEIANPTRKPRKIRIKLPPPPKTVSDLVGERNIKWIYEEQNTGSYEEGLKEAADLHGSRAWRKIWRAIDGAYLTRFSTELAPKPRVHFLHRGLLELANSEHLKGLTPEGLVGFLDDLCPCGKKHKPEAIRKLQARYARQHKH